MPPKPAQPLEFRAPLTPPPPNDDLGAELVRWLFPAYIFVMLIAFFILRSTLVSPSGNELNPDRAIFTAVNAATLTGFQLSIHPREFSVFGKCVLLALTVIGTLFTLTVGGLAVKRILRLPWADSRLVGAVFLIQAIVLFIGAVAPAGADQTLVGGMLQSCAAWANSGLYVSIPPVGGDLYTHAVLLPLAALGGLGITVVIEVFDALAHRRPLSRHAKLVLQLSAGLYLFGFAAYTAVQCLGLGTLWGNHSGADHAQTSLRQILVNASQMSINVRTAGMPLLQFDRLTTPLERLITFFTLILMVIGASPGGTGSGLKTTTVWSLVTAPFRALRGQVISRTFGIAAVWAGIYLVALIVIQLLLLGIERQLPPDRLLFMTISALSNVGLSHNAVQMTASGHLLLAAAMLFGRLAPLLVLWWMADTTSDAEIAVG